MALQRPLLLDELESFRYSVEEALTMVADKPGVNPAYIRQKRKEQASVEALLTSVKAYPAQDHFEVTGDTAALVACIQGGAGIACERLMNYADDLRPGAHAEDARDDLHAQLEAATIWVHTLLAAQQFEPDRGMPPVMLADVPGASDDGSADDAVSSTGDSPDAA